MTKKLSKSLKQRYDRAVMEREFQRNFLRDAYRFIRPNSNLWDEYGPVVKTPGEQKNIVVYDMTAPLAACQFTSKLHSVLTPPFITWAELTTGTLVPDNEEEQVKKDLELATEVMFDYINTSRFDLVVNEAYNDLIFGTAALRIEEGDDIMPLKFSSVPNATITIEESPDGIIRTVWMDFQLSPREIMELWPDAELPPSMNAEAKKETKQKVTMGTVWQYETKNYYRYIEMNTTIIWDEEIDSSEWIVFRWNRLAGETWGRGIAHDTMPTIKSLNKAIELLFRATELTIAPVFFGFSDDVINLSNVIIAPNTIIPISRAQAAQPPLIPLDMRPNIQLADLSIQKMTEWIQKAFMADPIGTMNDPTKTATEIDYRERLLLEQIGPAFGRLEVEFFGPVIERCVYILQKKGFMPLIKINGKEVKIKFSSPLAKTQDQSDLQNLMNSQQILATIYGPQLAAAARDYAKTVTFVAKKSGDNLDSYNDEDTLATIEALVRQSMLSQMLPQQAQPEEGQPPQQAPSPLQAAQVATQAPPAQGAPS
jgi:hypothetical protein